MLHLPLCSDRWRSRILLALWVTKLDTRCDSPFCPKLLQANCWERVSGCEWCGALENLMISKRCRWNLWYNAWKRDMDWRWRKIHLSQAGVANDSIVAARLVRHRPAKPSNQFKTRNNGEMVAGVSDSLSAARVFHSAQRCVSIDQRRIPAPSSHSHGLEKRDKFSILFHLPAKK